MLIDAISVYQQRDKDRTKERLKTLENFLKAIEALNIYDLAEEFDNDASAAVDHLETADKFPVNLCVICDHVIEVAHYESEDIACFGIITKDFQTSAVLTCYTAATRDEALQLQFALVTDIAARPELSASEQAITQMNRIQLRNRLS
jgi:hypothetical protein